jgi:hypothetical protein
VGKHICITTHLSDLVRTINSINSGGVKIGMMVLTGNTPIDTDAGLLKNDIYKWYNISSTLNPERILWVVLNIVYMLEKTTEPWTRIYETLNTPCKPSR